MVDALSLQIFANLFSSIAEEMGVALQQASYSPNIKMRRDFSCAVFDSSGAMLAQAAHIPVHLGAMPMAMEAVREAFNLRPGDVAMLNDPYAGGTHLPDISTVSGVFDGAGTLLGYVMCRAHHADIGGMTPGSMPLSTEIYQEGMIIPPVLVIEQGRTNQGLLDLFLRNVRTPDERRGDLAAQLAALRIGEDRLAALVERYGRDTIEEHGAALQDYAERMMRALIEHIPPGEYRFEDRLDDDGLSDDPVPIAVTVRREPESTDLILDFSSSSPQRLGPVNTVRAVTVSATLYVMRCLEGEDVPVNGGSLRPLHVVTSDSTVVSARPPGAVAAGNVETSQRIVDVLFGALAGALPERAPAASQGTMNNLAMGGFDPERQSPFAYYETMGGGMGARPTMDGLNAVHDHMSNTLNTPVEALESSYPVRIEGYQIRRGSGGAGKNRGGDGIQRDLNFLVRTEITVLSERRRFRPYGLAGGAEGEPGANIVFRGDEEQLLGGKAQFTAHPGDMLSLRSPGGGGWGKLPEQDGDC